MKDQLVLNNGALGLVLIGIILFLWSWRRRVLKGKKISDGRSCLIFFGSGGHTTEMLGLLKEFDPLKYSSFAFVISHSDKTSQGKIISSNLPLLSKAHWLSIYRSREVKQPIFSTILSTFRSLMESFILVIKEQPDLIICNGPGTCVPICLAAFIYRFLGLFDCKIVFVESFCRVEHLSLSGRLLYYFVDKFIVQWPQLAQQHTKCKYLGRIC